ncbi:hypothetical protein [Roseococcus sp.]|uniref:hypothetical protein n=1 Tax=Roseococcus sp. TaxID=2109646 RepID=UPI003BAC0E6B
MAKTTIGRVFDGTTLRVVDASRPADSDVLVITFPARSPRQGLDRRPFGQQFLQASNISSVHVTADRNHWFQTTEAEAAIQAIKPIAARFRRVVTYGSSMGGYGALAWSRRLGATDVVAISPQFSIDRRRVPWERRWSEEAATLDFFDDDMAENLNPDATVTLIFDPLTADGRHGAEITALSARASTLLAPFGGHPAGTFLRDIKLLSSAIRKLASGTADIPSLRRAIRQGRASSALYWSQRAAGLAKSKRLEAAREANHRALALAPDQANVCFAAGRLSIRLGDGAIGKEALLKAVALNPDEPKYRRVLEMVLADEGRRRGAQRRGAPA